MLTPHFLHFKYIKRTILNIMDISSAPKKYLQFSEAFYWRGL